MTDVVTPPSPAPAPNPVRNALPGCQTWIMNNLLTLVLLVGFGYYVYHNETSRPGVSKPPIVATTKAWRDGLGSQFASAASRVRNGQITTKDELVSFLNAPAKPMAKATDEALDPNCDKENGKITNAAAVVETLNQVAVGLGAKAQ